MKQYYLIELQRTRKTAYLVVMVFVMLSAFIFCLAFYSNKPDPILTQSSYLEYFTTMIAMIVGLITSILLITNLGSDVSSGVFGSYLSYPVRPREIILAKWLAKYTLIVPATIVPACILTVLISYFGATYSLMVVMVPISSLLMILAVCTLSSIFINHRPLPEIIAILFVLTISVFERQIPLEKPYLYALDPIPLLRDVAIGIEVPAEAAFYGLLSIVVYAGILFASFRVLEMKEWGRADRL